MSPVNRLFLSYAPENESLCTRLEKHLSPLERSGKAVIWHPGKLLPGEECAQVIGQQLNTADVILFLVTPDLLASDALHDDQIRPALARLETRSARVVPVLAEPCAWQTSVLAKLEPLPKNRMPIMLWPHPDEALAEIAAGVLDVLSDISAHRMARDIKGDIERIDKFVNEDAPELRITDLVGDTLEHPRDTWSKLLIMRAVLRRLLRKIADARGMRYSEYAGLGQMVADFQRAGIIDTNLANDINRIRVATFTVEWGAGVPPEPGELRFVIDNYQRVFQVLKTKGCLTPA